MGETSIFSEISIIMKKSRAFITREDFMAFFRNDNKLNSLTPDDRIEIFSQILTGNSDFTKELLDNLLFDYNVSNLEVIKLEDGKK